MSDNNLIDNAGTINVATTTAAKTTTAAAESKPPQMTKIKDNVSFATPSKDDCNNTTTATNQNFQKRSTTGNSNDNNNALLLRRPILFKKILRGSIIKTKKLPSSATTDAKGTKNNDDNQSNKQQHQQRRKINLKQLQKISFYGVPDSPKGLRSITWRVLLGLLPLRVSEWPERLTQKRALYKQFLNDFMTTQEDLLNNSEPTFEDNPLSTEPTSAWNTFYQDAEVKEAIAKDVHRTHPGYSFFTQGETYTVMKRMLFIFAKLNPGVSYIQGMNEVLAPLYYVFMTDTVQNADFVDDTSSTAVGKEATAAILDFNNVANVEADTFWCFMQLMGEIKDWFIPTLDKTLSGINGYINKYSNILVRQDPELAEYLDLLSIDPKFYTFRWITTMLSREFVLPDTVRLWDSLLSDGSRFDFLIYVCCAMVIRIRKTLLKSDFGEALKILQTYPSTDLNKLLLEAQVIKESEEKYMNGEVNNPLIGGENNSRGRKSSSRAKQRGKQYRKDVNEVVKVAQANAQIASEAISNAVSSGSVMAKRWYRSFSNTFDEWSQNSTTSKGNKQPTSKHAKQRTAIRGKATKREGNQQKSKTKNRGSNKHTEGGNAMSSNTAVTKSVFDILSTDLGLNDVDSDIGGNRKSSNDDGSLSLILNDVDAMLGETDLFLAQDGRVADQVPDTQQDSSLKMDSNSPSMNHTNGDESSSTTAASMVAVNILPPTKQLSTSPILIDKKQISSGDEFVMVE